MKNSTFTRICLATKSASLVAYSALVHESKTGMALNTVTGVIEQLTPLTILDAPELGVTKKDIAKYVGLMSAGQLVATAGLCAGINYLIGGSEVQTESVEAWT